MEPIAAQPEAEDRKSRADNARAVLNSGTQDADGRYNLEFRNAPWANGAVFVLNPNPELPATAEQPTKAFLTYTLGKGAIKPMTIAVPITRRDSRTASIWTRWKGWADVLDYPLYAHPGVALSAPIRHGRPCARCAAMVLHAYVYALRVAGFAQPKPAADGERCPRSFCHFRARCWTSWASR